MNFDSIKSRIVRLLRDYFLLEARPSHLIIAAMIIVGGVINLVFAHGWTVWPFVLAFGMLTYINEAVDRSGQGIPPIHVYGFFVAAGAVWLTTVLFLWSINPLILILGIAVVGYRVAEAFIRQRERERLIAFRRATGVCLHCGEVYDPNASVCPSCWEEPNPDIAVLKRVAQICRSPQDMARARAVLTRKAPAGSAAAKEQALINRHHGVKTPPASPLPKAAKLGPQPQGRNRK
jgi:hypothetical protein